MAILYNCVDALMLLMMHSFFLPFPPHKKLDILAVDKVYFQIGSDGKSLEKVPEVPCSSEEYAVRYCSPACQSKLENIPDHCFLATVTMCC